MWPKWVEVCKELRSITLDQNYKRYIEPLVPVSSENGTWIIQAPSEDVKKRVEKHYAGEFEKTIQCSVELRI
jgi:chromosomal replication initiation ATPase DnaA